MQNLNLFDMFANAGPMVQFVMLLLVVFSTVSWSIVFMKFKLFKKVRQETDRFLEMFWKSKSLAEAYKEAAGMPLCPEANIFRHGYNELQKIGKARSAVHSGEQTLDMQLATMDNLKRTLRKVETREVARLGTSLAFLATTGSATPFIGLFGTVWGIMNSFHEIGLRGSASLAVVAPGISEALVATAGGLAVAIPAVIFYNYYANQLTELETEMQSFSSDFLNLVERDLLTRVS